MTVNTRENGKLLFPIVIVLLCLDLS